MPRHAKTLSVGQDNTRHLSEGLMATCFPAAEIQRIVSACGKASKHIRDLPPVVVAYYVIASSLFPGVAYRNVLEWLLCGLRWLDVGRFRISGKGSLSRARARLGEEPVRRMFDELARPLRLGNLPGSYWRGLHLVAVDGTALALQDSASNDEAFGRSSNEHGPGAYPICRCVLLCEVGTHIIFAGSLGSYRDAERSLARKVLRHLEPGMLCLADRLFPGYELWRPERRSFAEQNGETSARCGTCGGMRSPERLMPRKRGGLAGVNEKVRVMGGLEGARQGHGFWISVLRDGIVWCHAHCLSQALRGAFAVYEGTSVAPDAGGVRVSGGRVSNRATGCGFGRHTAVER